MAEVTGEGEGQARVRRVTARSGGERWPGRNGPKDLDAPRRSDEEDETLRYVAAGATEKGAVPHGTGASPCRTGTRMRK